MKFDFKNIIQIVGLTSIFNTNNNSATSLSIINNSTTSLQTIGTNSGSKMIFSEHNSDILNSIEEMLTVADKKYGDDNIAELDHLEPAEDLAPSLQALFSVEECFKENVIIECPTSSPPILQQPSPIYYTYDVDLKKWGYFKVYDAFYNRGYGEVVTSMFQTIAIIGKMFGEEFTHSYPIKKHDCTVDISPPPYGQGESGIYAPQNENDIIRCQIRASSYVNSDYRVLVHEMFHALFNGLLQGKYDSMPRMFTEGFARAAMYYDTEYLAKWGTPFVPGIITKLEGQCNKIFSDMPALFECIKNSYFDNYALGESYFYFCRNTSPNTLPNYIKKIIKEPVKSYYNKHNAGDLIGVGDLEANCSMDNFKKWLKNPDFTKGSSDNHDITDEPHYIVSVCDNRVHKVLICDEQSQPYCSITNGNISYSSNDRLIFQDSKGIAIIIFQGKGFTFLRKRDNININDVMQKHPDGAKGLISEIIKFNDIEKRICIEESQRVKSWIEEIAKYEGCDYADYIKNLISNWIEICKSGSLTPKDISLFLNNNNNAGSKDNNHDFALAYNSGVHKDANKASNHDFALAYNSGVHKDANKASNHDFALVCDNGVHKVLVCDKQAQLSTPGEFINKNCSIADGDTHYPPNSRFIFWDSNGNIKVTILEDSKLTSLYKEDNNIIKYICIKWDEWFKSVMQSIAKYEDCNYTDYIKNFTSNEIKYCESGYPTPEDISLFSDNNNDAGNKDNNSFNTWKIAGIVGGATTLLGVVGTSICIIQSKKNKATDAESQPRGISEKTEELIPLQNLLSTLQAKAGPGVTVVKTPKEAKELIEIQIHQEASPIYANLSENSDFEDSGYEIPCTGNHADYITII